MIDAFGDRQIMITGILGRAWASGADVPICRDGGRPGGLEAAKTPVRAAGTGSIGNRPVVHPTPDKSGHSR